MKKKIFAILLSFTILSTSIICYASEKNEILEPTMIQDEWYDIIDSLSEEEYGGIYVEDNTLHIKPIDTEESIKAMQEVSRRRSSDIIIDDTVAYSYAQLKEAQDRLFDHRKELDIDATEIRNMYNSIIVTAKEWDEEKKKTVKEIAGVDNIIFEVYNGDYYDSQSSTISVEDIIPMTYETYYIGSKISNSTQNDAPASTLGACAKSGSVEGFITTAHGNALDDKMVGVAQDVFGKIKKIQMGGKIDAAFIAKESIGNIPLTNQIIIGKNSNGSYKTGTVSSAGGVIENAVLRYGNISGYSIAVVESTSWSGNWNGNLDPNNSYNDMIKLDIGTQSGDSGGPLFSMNSDGTYRIVGITKGTFNDGSGLATKWSNIANIFGVTIYK